MEGPLTLVDGTVLPPVFANYTPIIAASAGVFTAVSATGRWGQIGKLVFVTISITITTNGTASGYVVASLPTTVNSSFVISGREINVVGKMLQGIAFGGGGGNTLAILNYDNSYPGGNGYGLVISGLYESQ
jgi:hypothetical protein